MHQATIPTAHDPGRKVDPREQHFRITSPIEALRLLLRYLPPTSPAEAPQRIALYVHGGTFPSALSIAHRFDGESWRDVLCSAGFHTWGLDFHGFGALSDPYPEMVGPADAHPPLGRVDSASRQLERAVRFICNYHRTPRISLIAHSWGTMVAGHLAGRCPELIERMVFFGAIAPRPATSPAPQPRHGGLFRSRTNGTASSRTFPQTSRLFCRGGISMTGASAISTPIPPAARGLPPR